MGLLLNFAAFAFGLYLAWSGQWSTRDLVWSFWLTSLVVGSLTLLSTIFAIAVDGWRTKARMIPAEVLANEARLPMIRVSRVSSAVFLAVFVYHVSRSWIVSIAIALIGVCLGLRRPGSPFDKVLSSGLHLVGVLITPLFLLVFFTIHFGIFHLAHAGFLHFIFPLSELSALNLGGENLNLNSASENLALVQKILLGAFEGIFVPYGLLVLTTLFAEREKILQPLTTVFSKSSAEHPTRLTGRNFVLPYINVMKTHLLIFPCFFAKALHLEHSFWLFVVGYTLFYLPTLITSLRSEKASTPGR